MKPGPGTEWNNAITRRSFLKRTGGATLATMVTWHGLQTSAFASAPPKAKVVLKVVITVPNGETLPVPIHPDNPPTDWTNIQETGEMNSGDTLSDWEFTFEANVRIVDGEVQGPAVITCTRRIIRGQS